MCASGPIAKPIRTSVTILSVIAVFVIPCMVFWMKLQSNNSDSDHKLMLSQCVEVTYRYLYAQDSSVYHLDGTHCWRRDVARWFWLSQPRNAESEDLDTNYYNLFFEWHSPWVKDQADSIVYAIIYEDRILRCDRPRAVPVFVAIPSRPSHIYSRDDVTILEFESFKADGIPMWAVDSHGTAWRVSEGYKMPGPDR